MLRGKILKKSKADANEVTLIKPTVGLLLWSIQMKNRVLLSLKRNPFQSVFASFALDILSEANNDNRYNERKVFTT